MDALGAVDLKHVAVADKEFAKMLGGANAPNESDRIVFAEYKPNQLTYKVNLTNDRVAVFSEIYYPHGWHLYCGNFGEQPIARVNYMLRAARLPAGEYELTMVFDPEAVKKGDMLSIGCMVVFLLTLLAAIWQYCRGRKKRESVNSEK